MNVSTDTIVPRGRLDARARAGGQWRLRWLRLVLMVVVPLVLLLSGAWWFLASEGEVSTDDAYGQADMVTVSSNVAGRVVEVDVHDNEYVKAGQVLFRLDDRPFRIAVERAQAQLASARLQVQGFRAAYREHLSDLQAARDTLAYEQREFERQQTLIASHVSSQAQFDQMRHALDAAREQAAGADQQLANVLANLGGDPNIQVDQHPLVQQAQAQLAQAQLDLSYTTITAPGNGIVSKVSQLPVGNYLTTAAPAFSLIETDHVWVEANFKETQLTHMKVGDAVDVSVDAYPDTVFKGRVASFTPGTGSQFSVLPPQNATGNWVKVVQRLPVRIEIENPNPDKPLRPGMSVTADVDTGYQNPLAGSIDSFLGYF